MKTKKVEYSIINKCPRCGKWAIKGKTYCSKECRLNHFRTFTIREPKRVIYNKSWA